MARQFFDPNASSAQPGMAMQMRAAPLSSADMAQRMIAPGAAPQANLNELWMNMEVQKHAQMSAQQMREQDSAWAAEFGSAMSRMQTIPAGQSSVTETGPAQNCM